MLLQDYRLGVFDELFGGLRKYVERRIEVCESWRKEVSQLNISEECAFFRQCCCAGSQSVTRSASAFEQLSGTEELTYSVRRSFCDSRTSFAFSIVEASGSRTTRKHTLEQLRRQRRQEKVDGRKTKLDSRNFRSQSLKLKL